MHDNMTKVFRVFTEKKPGFDVSVRALSRDIDVLLGIKAGDMREFLRYDVQNISEADFNAAIYTVFAEPQADSVYLDKLPGLDGYRVFIMEFLPGQYDQRADSCMQCVQALTGKEKPLVKCARVIALKGVGDKELESVKRYLINPVESRETDAALPASLELKAAPPEPTPTITGFIKMAAEELNNYYNAAGFAMTPEDLAFVQDYFIKEGRDPTLTELKALDTYWSDHCRHTTFNTELTDIAIEEGSPYIEEAYNAYTGLRKELYKDRPDKYPCLMDMATIAMRKFKKEGRLNGLEESEEINACTVKVKAKIGGRTEDWLVMFKNETHNHPTEIEPFGGAATCLGGGIRDPLSGRAYVYQGMRLTGAADPTVPLKETMKGKLPQRVLTKTAAEGFCSYGSQIGLSTGIVKEFYHPGFAAKRMEAGFIIGAAPQSNVVKEKPVPGDVVILLGGDTGRDGCGGATGSSRSHSLDSLEVCGAEVQKGNAFIERNIQRLFRAPESSRLIKRCNDFGAGGVCVAIGELADGLDINLNAVPLKYEGLTATEIAISESQERMAVVVSKENADKFIELSKAQNLKATVVAAVTDKNRMIMTYDGKTVLDIKRAMLNSSGVRQRVTARVAVKGADYFDALDPETEKAVKAGDIEAALKISLAKLNVCSQKGLIEMFDSSAAAVFTSLGGKLQLTPSMVMAAKLPAGDAAETATVCSWGYDPYLMSENAYLGAVYALLTSIIKVVVSGVNPDTVYLTLQEYFKRLQKDPVRWGQPTAALLGAMYTQLKMGMAAVGGKDSMSGTFEDIDVPPTLLSFAVGTADASKLVPNVFGRPGQKVYLLPLKRDKYMMPDFDYVKKLLKAVYGETQKGRIAAVAVSEAGGAACTVMKSCFGNGLGFDFNKNAAGGIGGLFQNRPGDIIIAAEDVSAFEGFDIRLLGETTAGRAADKGLLEAFTGKLEPVFPTKPFETADGGRGKAELITSAARPGVKPFAGCAKPRVFMPLFPGTNCDYETADKFRSAGAVPEIRIIRNQSAADISGAVNEIAENLKASQILMLTGGFSGGGEPVGGGKFIAAMLRHPKAADALREFLTVKRGLVLGISGGFKALINTGLLPYGEMRESKPGDPALAVNSINRYVACIAEIRVASVLSPWLSACAPGDRFLVPVSHGEGRFTASGADLKRMAEKGQIATQYYLCNPNGSDWAVEGITDPTGLIFGKMGHAERAGKDLFKNVPGNYDMKIFESGVKYFR